MVVASTERKAELQLSLLQTMHVIMYSGNSVCSVTIPICFTKAGFAKTSEQLAEGLNEKYWKKVTSNPEIIFRDFVNCAHDLLTIARMTTEEICSAANKENKASESEVEVEETSVLHLGKQFLGLRLFEGTASFTLDDASLA
jgi:hypothetical protein